MVFGSRAHLDSQYKVFYTQRSSGEEIFEIGIGFGLVQRRAIADGGLTAFVPITTGALVLTNFQGS